MIFIAVNLIWIIVTLHIICPDVHLEQFSFLKLMFWFLRIWSALDECFCSFSTSEASFVEEKGLFDSCVWKWRTLTTVRDDDDDDDDVTELPLFFMQSNILCLRENCIYIVT